MAVTIAPKDEACQALVALVNAGVTYTLYRPAEYFSEFQDDLKRPPGLLVDVVHETESTLQESLSREDRTSHAITVYFRDKLTDTATATVAVKSLLFRKLFQQINVHLTGNPRVKIWDCDYDEKEVPDKTVLQEYKYFRAAITMRLEVDAS